jgi:glycerol kinase
VSEADDGVVVAVDQGTSSTKVVVLDSTGSVIGSSSRSIGQAHPRPGWVEQDADEIYTSVVDALETALAENERRVAAVGLSSQRESAVVWDAATGKPLGPMLGWQDRRTSDEAERLTGDGNGARVRELSGLPLDPMFSALKFAWLLDEVDPDRRRAAAGKILLGTVDSWLLHRLTGEHRIEAGNASRTQLLNLDRVDWDVELLALFRIPRASLPRVTTSIEPSRPIAGVPVLGAGVSITAVLGDSHAALYGHGARNPGDVKVTYGTGSSVMGLLPQGVRADGALVRTIAWSTGQPSYAFEGNILSTGATLVWAARLLGIGVSELTELAQTVSSSSGVSLVPAFAGLGAPWWDDRATAVLSGFDLGTDRAQLARAAMESIPLQVEDVLTVADASVGRVERILADGGPSSNSWLMQLQADLSQRDVRPSTVPELSAAGAAHLAGESAGMWSADEVAGFAASAAVVHPVIDPDDADAQRRAWLSAVARARSTPSAVDSLQRSTS